MYDIIIIFRPRPSGYSTLWLRLASARRHVRNSRKRKIYDIIVMYIYIYIYIYTYLHIYIYICILYVIYIYTFLFREIREKETCMIL